MNGFLDSTSSPSSCGHFEADIVLVLSSHFFTAMFLTAIYGFLRVGEITCKTTNSGSSVLQHQDLSFRLLKGKVIAAKLTLTNFQHNRSGRPFYIHILRQQGSEYCPLQALKRFSILRGSRSGPLLT